MLYFVSLIGFVRMQKGKKLAKYIDAEDFFDVFPEIDRIPYSSWAVTHIADVRPVIKGKWIYKKDLKQFFCDQCEEPSLTEDDRYIYGMDFSNFCPNCGADMRGEDDEAD